MRALLLLLLGISVLSTYCYEVPLAEAPIYELSERETGENGNSLCAGPLDLSNLLISIAADDSFLMGVPSDSLIGDADEQTADGDQPTMILEDYEIMSTEVTNGMYAQFLNCKAAEGRWTRFHLEMSGDPDVGGIERTVVPVEGSRQIYEYHAKPARTIFPVTYVDYLSAREFCAWAGDLRLPNEVEWEYAARSGLGATDNVYPWGGDFIVGNYNDAFAPICQTDAAFQTDDPEEEGCGLLRPVGNYAQNFFNIFDMAGNAEEWTESIYTDTLPPTQIFSDSESPIVDLTIRGGHYLSPPLEIRTTIRTPLRSDNRRSTLGFRCAR